MVSVNYAGSQWSKWDLHIHSNASDGKGTPEQIIQKAKEKGMDVIALTDHHTFRNIDIIKELGRENGITVISGIEFRTEYGAKSVHMIGLFPDMHNEIKLTQQALNDLILIPLNLSETLITAKGKAENSNLSDEQAFKKGMSLVQVDFKKAAKLIHMYGGLVSVHAGNKANSIEEMKHDGTGASNVKDVIDSLGPVKDELLREHIDICELGSLQDKNASFYIKTYGKPAIVASDAHKVDDIGRLYTWIKADKTFEGLKQIIYEPELRTKIQENIPNNKSDYQVIDSISISGEDFGEQIIPFNQDLNVIIGGRSSGKSILLGCIAKLANYKGLVKSGNDSYNKYIDTIIENMKLKWKDDTEGLSHKVEYFPQSYINKLASVSKEAIVLIEKILKGEDKRREIFEAYHNDNNKNLFEITNEIENYFKLHYKLEEIQEEAKELGDIRGVQNEITKIESEILQVKKNSNVKMSEDDELLYDQLKKERERLSQDIVTLESAHRQLSDIKNVLIVREIKTELIGLPDNVKNVILSGYAELAELTQRRWEELVLNEINNIKLLVEHKKQRINVIESDEKYVNGEKYYKENETIKQLSTRLNDERRKEEKLAKIGSKQTEIIEQILQSKEKIFRNQKAYFDIGQAICNEVQLEKDGLSIEPKLTYNQQKIQMFVDTYLYARNHLAKEIQEAEVVDNETLIKLLINAFDGIINGEVTLKGGKEKKQAIIELVSTNYYYLRYNVIYQGDTLSSMSEGKKAFVILRLLLDFDENKYPILIDQPEDDLDNRAIYNDLVTYIRNKKLERQMILVTHNPNITVATDAEEIIVANQHGVHTENQDGIKFEYRSGSIENTYKRDETKTVLLSQGIREHVCDLLEGGDIAFKKRENKYGLKENTQ